MPRGMYATGGDTHNPPTANTPLPPGSATHPQRTARALPRAIQGVAGGSVANFGGSISAARKDAHASSPGTRASGSRWTQSPLQETEPSQALAISRNLLHCWPSSATKPATAGQSRVFAVGAGHRFGHLQSNRVRSWPGENQTPKALGSNGCLSRSLASCVTARTRTSAAGSEEGSARQMPEWSG
jgi:hypothetical protein